MLRNALLLIVFFFASLGVAAEGLKVGISTDYPPLAYKQEGRIVGIEADNATAVGAILGRKMTMVEMPFEKLIPALQAGEIDVIMSGMSVTSARGEQVIFTDSYMEVGQMAIMLMDNAGQFSQPWSIYRKGVRVGVEPGTTGAEFAKIELEEAQISYFSTPSAAFDGLRNDDIDLYVHDAPTSWQLATSQDNEDLLSLYSPLTNEQLAWAVRKDDERLAQSLNAALQTMKGSGSLRYILNRWIPVTVEVR
ncbi:substrate-binding periplasmic protein [Halioglobus sp. Uisw_031]|jgi:ABC-type amino acid transport substrate-binding protein|uniref:substrate-binding periplasmic protein n=1 Tax=Halioglobus sp. Uisw_031 TaxID=3230977 RepID=UPI0039EB5A93